MRSVRSITPALQSAPPRLPRTPAARGLRTIGRPSFPHVNPPQPCIPGRFPITASERTPPKLVTRSVPGTSRNRIANQSNAERRGARAVVKRHCRPEKSAPKTTPAKRITRAWFTRPASIHRPICTSSRPPRRPYASRRPCRHERISPTYQDPHWRQEPHAPQASILGTSTQSPDPAADRIGELDRATATKNSTATRFDADPKGRSGRG